MKHIISLGAGVQSSTMALMAAHGEIEPMPDCAIFADTQAEPRGVYDWLDWLEGQLPFPVHRVTRGSLKDIIGQIGPNGKHAKNPIPAFADQANGVAFPLARKCTADYKIAEIERKAKELAGISGRLPKTPVVIQWMGISLDEITRMKHSRQAWAKLRYPLIEQEMTRGDCLEWMKRNGYPEPVKSACTFCPFHNDATWRDMKLNDPESWAEAVEVDERIRTIWTDHQEDGRRLYLHRSLKPLAEVDFRNLEDLGQLNMFENECEGMCGI